jgi:nucleotide-binding universal stress UspA family protein
MYSNLLVPVDGTDISEQAMRSSVALASQLGARITAFVAEPGAPIPPTGQTALGIAHQHEMHAARTDRHARELLARFEATARAAGVAFAGHHVCTDQIDDAIVAAAAEHGCDMIVMVTHGRSALARFFHGSHTAGVMARSKLPVLVLH